MLLINHSFYYNLISKFVLSIYFHLVIYSVLKIYARLAIKIYCRKVVVNRPEVLKMGGPLLLAANHPNSFLDGMILTTLFDQPVYSLARGDAFKNRLVNFLLRSIQLLPVYRFSEGTKNLEHNYTTFDACQQTFEDRGIVLIFTEGGSVNEWHLRPLKKGAARLALTAWQKNIPLTVIPVGLNYSSFKKFGKEVHVLFGRPITQDSMASEDATGRQMNQFTDLLKSELEQLVYEIDPADKEKIRRVFHIRRSFAFYLLLLPALIGWILHAPLFYLVKLFIEYRFKHSDHYDSMFTSLLIIFYPFYLLLIALFAGMLLPVAALLTIIILPLTARACVQVKYQIIDH
jgi:1-acyl-sn-glycerol-3-phosphate acyltransferase